MKQPPVPLRHILRVSVLLALALVLLELPSAFATPKNRKAFFAAYPGAVGTRLDNLPSNAGHCGVCHYDFNGGGTRNRYGRKVEAALPLFPNTDQGKQDAILSIQNEDSDGDGVANVGEITDLVTYSNTPTFPGLQPANVDSISNVNAAEVTPYIVPTVGADVTPPVVQVLTPNGGESWTGGSSHAVTWNATDDIGVVSVDVEYRDSETTYWSPIARGLTGTNTFTWFVPNTPTTAARVRVVAYDAAANAGSDSSDVEFSILQTPGGTVPTTLRDFQQPGTQPLGGGTFESHEICVTCHGGYDQAVEPGFNFLGSMMGQAARDPLFYACLAIAEQDAPSSGDLCIRCHSAFGWLSGRSQPTSGAALTTLDRDGVACDLCHRMVDPVYKPGVSPTEDQNVLANLLPAHDPTTYANGQYVVDPDPRKRGPFNDAVAPHSFLASEFHKTGEFCGTCHDVSNPVFNRTGTADYEAGTLDEAAPAIDSNDLMPLERTYSEWKNSSYPAGVYAPEFAGNKPDGVVATCQDCHMHSVSGTGCNDPTAPVRADLPLHDLTGGNAWMPPLIALLYPTETDASALAAGAARATSMLQKSAGLDLAVAAQGDSFLATVTVTNHTGHKLPTGYPEGRRMWLHVVGLDGTGQQVYESGAYDAATGVLTEDADAVVYEAHLGISPALASALGLPDGPSFHFALNDSVYKDNRIPPLGFTNAAFETFGGQPVDPDPGAPTPRYADGQNWDDPTFALPAEARKLRVELMYQTTSKDYVQFLADSNVTNSAGQDLYDLWAANGRSAPVVMATDSVTFGPLAVGPGSHLPDRLALGRNPFRGTLELELTLASAVPVKMDVFDLAGRALAHRDRGVLQAGTHRLVWNGRTGAGLDAGSGTFWVRVTAGQRRWVERVVRLR